MSDLALGLRLELYRSSRLEIPVDLVRHAERLGYHSVWSAEAYGADALSPLAYLAGLTSRIRLATGIAQLAARPPTTLAMHAMTIDAMAGGGRVILGIGVSGPQIVEGWYGQPWGVPHERLRDYVTILRAALDREGPLRYEGREISLPYRGPGSIGQGKALRSILHPSARIGVWIAAGGPRNTALAAQLADGWLPMGLGPEGTAGYAEVLADGFKQRNDGRSDSEFEIFGGCSVQITDDVGAALDAMRPLTGMYVGGMGSPTHNYHRDSMARRGFPEHAARIAELWQAGCKEEAIAAVPDDYLESQALLGSPSRIRRRWETGFVAPGVTGLIVGASRPDELALMAELAGIDPFTPDGGGDGS
jgi:F420-dependent oxidoreductase-like protein